MYQKYTIHTTSNTTIYHNHHYQFHEYVLPLICTPPSVLWPGPNGIENFQTRDFRDRILQNPGIPGFFGTGLALNFYPRILPKKRSGSLRVTFSAHKFGQFHTFWTTYLLVEYPWRIFTSSCFLWSGSSSPSCDEQQERADVQCFW